MLQEKLLTMTIAELFAEYPYAGDFFTFLSVRPDPALVLTEFLDGLEEEMLADMGLTRPALLQQFTGFMQHMQKIRQQSEQVNSITIIGGRDKAGASEQVHLTIRTGEIISIVGATGSGKSRLLADIEWLAQQDTPTKRQILINGHTPDTQRRFSIEQKLVAQLSQNMNFVMDLTVTEFVSMHAESRMLGDIEQITANIIAQANTLAGERFSPRTPVTALSGGQSRALMVADVAFLSACPVVLIDELENAGIDRRQALRLLVDKQKIVLMATHDPILALMGDKRLIIENGAIRQVLETSPQERENLAKLEKLDWQMTVIRNALRRGERIDSPDFL